MKSLSSFVLFGFFHQKSKLRQKQEPKMTPMMALKTPTSGPKLSRGGVSGSDVRSAPWAEATGKGREGVNLSPGTGDWGLKR